MSPPRGNGPEPAKDSPRERRNRGDTLGTTICRRPNTGMGNGHFTRLFSGRQPAREGPDDKVATAEVRNPAWLRGRRCRSQILRCRAHVIGSSGSRHYKPLPLLQKFSLYLLRLISPPVHVVVRGDPPNAVLLRDDQAHDHAAFQRLLVV